MAEADIVQNLIAQLGQSQKERTPRELDAHYAGVDGRSTAELYRWLRRFAPLVNFHPTAPGDAAADWSSFLPAIETGGLASYLAQNAGRVPPHLALLLAFLELYRRPQAVANEITGRHLDFYYRDVLRLSPRDPVPDRAHVVIELKKGAPSTAITPQLRFSAGKDSTGVELLYAPVREAVVGHAAVASLRTIYLDPAGRGTVRFAPAANSSDGLGGALPKDEPGWSGFGSAQLPRAEIGFAIASPLLRLQEGVRKLTLTLTLSGVDHAHVPASLSNSLQLFLTGEKEWIEPASFTATLSGDTLRLVATLAADAPAVVDYQAAVHGYAYAAEAPIAQILLRDGANIGYRDLRDVVVRSARVEVDVSGVSAGLTLESDAGALNPKKAFLPFGPQPAAGSRFMVAYPEALSKKLSELKLAIQWKDAPANLGSWYADYGVSGVSNGYFTVRATFEDASGAPYDRSGIALFDASNAGAEHQLVLSRTAVPPDVVGTGRTIRALSVAGAAWARREALRTVAERPVFRSHLSAPAPAREGFVTLTLQHGFMAAEYRKQYVAHVLKYAKSGSGEPVILNEPYTPAVQGISLSYRASSDTVAISSASLADFANPDIQFFQVAPFGPLREHGYQRSRLPFVSGTDVRLLPPITGAGELLIGLAPLAPGDGVSLLFQVATGSADPELPHERLSWSALCDNHWKPLAASELVLDTTNDLLASGIVKLVIPAEATTINTVLPAGFIWLRATVPTDPAAVCQLVDVVANAVEVRFEDRGNDPGHLAQPLPAGRITKLRDGLAAVKGVTQPYASFGGAPAEGSTSFRTRTAERLRHKDRCITPWDYERIVLDAFPRVHRVKCVPHARDGEWNAPGHVLLVVVPDLRNRNAVDPLQPRVDADTLSRIATHVGARAGMQVQVAVKNPRYQKVRLNFKVKLRTGYDFNHYRGELEQALIQALSPWASDAAREPGFGGAVYRSALLEVVEQLPYVDYVTDFRMYSFAGSVVDTTDLEVARPATPDTLLVSDSSHSIAEVG